MSLWNAVMPGHDRRPGLAAPRPAALLLLPAPSAAPPARPAALTWLSSGPAALLTDELAFLNNRDAPPLGGACSPQPVSVSGLSHNDVMPDHGPWLTRPSLHAFWRSFDAPVALWMTMNSRDASA